MKTIKTYSTAIEAHIAKGALDAAEIPAVIIGVDLAMEGGIAGVRLQVPENCVDAAMEILEGF